MRWHRKFMLRFEKCLLMFGSTAADSIRILYGGSMKPENAAGLLSQKDVDGGLIGGASLTARAFVGIVEAAQSI